MEIDDPTYDITYGGQCVNNDPPNVFLYPVEYNSYGSGSSVEMTYRFDGTDWVKHFKVTDHLGNIRSVLKDDSVGGYTITGQYDYKPFGGIFNSYINADNHRQSFIGKEKDNESSLGDFGVRKYDDFTGRFFQIDPLWEKYYSWTPYHYSANNPVSFLDPGGMLVCLANFDQKQTESYLNALNTINKWAEYSSTIRNVMDKALGYDYFINQYGFNNKPTEDNRTLSEFFIPDKDLEGNDKSIEDLWNSTINPGGTFKGSKKQADVIIFTNPEINPWVQLDELMHAVDETGDSQSIQHKVFYNKIKQEFIDNHYEHPSQYEKAMWDILFERHK